MSCPGGEDYQEEMMAYVKQLIDPNNYCRLSDMVRVHSQLRLTSGHGANDSKPRVIFSPNLIILRLVVSEPEGSG